MATEQPKYKLVGRIGDQDPVAYGGGFVYVDETGVYPPRLDYIEPAPDEEWNKQRGAVECTIYRIDLDPPRFKTNGPQPDWTRETFGKPGYRGISWRWHREWFAQADRITGCATSCGQSPFSLLREFASKDPMTRARAYESMFGYLGPHEFDHDPLKMSETEAYERYHVEMGIPKPKPATVFTVDTPDDERENVYELIPVDDASKLIEIEDEDDLIAAAQMFSETKIENIETAKISLNYHVAYGGKATDKHGRFFDR